MGHCAAHTERQRCEDGLSALVTILQDEVIGSLNKGLYKGHIERLVLFMEEKLSGIECMGAGKMSRGSMDSTAV